MYKNRICRPTPKSAPNRQPQFFIRRSKIAFDERVRYIESVCQVLIESRFGACLVEPVVIDLSDRPEPAAFSDLLDDEPNGQVAFYVISAQGRADYQVVEAAYRRGKRMELGTQKAETRPVGSVPAPALTPNQGRGSP